MADWRVGAAVAVAAVAAVVAACGGNPEGTATTFTGADGAALYAQACASCHGADLRGTDQGPPFLDAIYRPGHHADAAFFLAAKAGARAHHWNFGNMPPVEGLTDAQIEAIVAFVREEQRAVGIE
ncbi:MAG: cytochrome c [Dehalococcoidia bacterium]|nr:cytochrome c [Dehalococcoidia bacterium]